MAFVLDARQGAEIADHYNGLFRTVSIAGNPHAISNPEADTPVDRRSGERRSSADGSGTGLVAIIVVFVLLLIGSAAAYFLIRRFFARQREKRAAAAAAAAGEVVPAARTMAREKEAAGVGVGGGVGNPTDRGRKKGRQSDVEKCLRRGVLD
ncbi:hypothetical protein F5Y19DRAFT_468982 [Xylariaceae sp. FL1651]|nr:hypothetical protein F5Y19DRAFT_468982 [Xylariaceae sp. FL1651]